MLWQMWQWFADNGLAIASLVILLILVPRIRRFVLAIATGNIDSEDEQAKGRRALLGAVVYIIEVIAYFVLVLTILSKFGISLTAAAIPATVVSAAIGFGAQGVIADLLGGVFIIAEKQYGIGDWVEFHAPSGTVQGDVVNMTLRATTIRTLNGEEVIVPNSEARMCINYSSQWSRAVVEVPVPMTAGGSIKDLEERTLAAANRAISLDKVKNSILSEISLQSSTALNPPTAMGLPWTVTMRLVVDCSPGDQWLIERAIRAAVIDTWWDDYGERASQTAFGPAEQITGHARDTTILSQLQEQESREASAPTEAIPAAEMPTGEIPTGAKERGSNSRSDIPKVGAHLDDVRREKEEKEALADAAPDEPRSSWADMTRRERIRAVLSAGGRARVSTVILLVVLAIVGVLNLATLETENGPSGWLAPSRWNETTNTTSSTPATPTESTPVTTDNSAPTQQPPTQTSETAAPGDGDAGANHNQTQAPQSSASPSQTTAPSTASQGAGANPAPAPAGGNTGAEPSSSPAQ
nr:mechanosensitive ion channel family protein [Corynebacterium lactis]